MSAIDRAINDACTDYLVGRLPDNITHLIHLLRRDLVFGPIYFNVEGEECSPFDEDMAEPFNFSSAVADVSDWFHTLTLPMYVNIMIPACVLEDGTEERMDSLDIYSISEEYWKKIIFGKDLAPYID